MSEHEGLNQVRIRLSGTMVTVSWDEAQELKRRADAPGTRRITETLDAVGVSRPAVLASRQDAEAIVTVIDAWEDPPTGIRSLYAATRSELSG